MSVKDLCITSNPDIAVLYFGSHTGYSRVTDSFYPILKREPQTAVELWFIFKFELDFENYKNSLTQELQSMGKMGWRVLERQNVDPPLFFNDAEHDFADANITYRLQVLMDCKLKLAKEITKPLFIKNLRKCLKTDTMWSPYWPPAALSEFIPL